MSERERLEREIETVAAERKAARREENAAAREAQKYAQRAIVPLSCEDLEPLDGDGRGEAFKRHKETTGRREELDAQRRDLRRKLDSLPTDSENRGRI